MRRARLVLAGLALVVGPACTQDDDPLAPGLQFLPDRAHSRILTLEIKESHDRIREDVVRSAESMPAEHFDFRPTPDVRTFGQLVGHVATTLYVMCAAAGAENNPHPALVEQTVSGKADLVDALRAAYDYCEKATASLNDVNGLNKVTASREGTRLSFLVAAIEHSSLHYGSMVTYMRLNGLVPASSDRRDVVPPAPVQDQQPPANSPPLLTLLEYRFPTQDNRSLRFVRTYVLQAETSRHVSVPSQDRWVSYSEAEPVILDDAERFWKSGQFESLWVDVVDRPFENGVIGRLVVFNFVEQADIEIPTGLTIRRRRRSTDSRQQATSACTHRPGVSGRLGDTLDPLGHAPSER